VLPQVVRQPKQVAQTLQLEQRLETTYQDRMLHVPFGAVKFEAAIYREQAKAWRSVQMNFIALPLQMLHEFQQGIIAEL